MIRVVSQNLPQFKQWELSYQIEHSYKITVQNVWIQNEAQMDKIEEDWNRLLFLMFDICLGDMFVRDEAVILPFKTNFSAFIAKNKA